MKNIIDYINEFKNVNFTERPFQAVDGLVLACFAYLNFNNKVPSIKEKGGNVTLYDLSKADNYEEMFRGTYNAINSQRLFEAMLDSVRFGSVELNYYINEYDEKEEKQFSAITIFFDQNIFISFRGTDQTLIGWKEDFNMIYMPVVPAQISSESYINYVGKLNNSNIYVGGHSKGGNLAVYSASNCIERVAKKIVAVYSYDGPGFKEDIFMDQGYMRIVDRLQIYVPDLSIVGLLLQQQADYFIIKSNQIGIFQHDAFSWIVKNGDFVYLENLKNEAIQLDNSLNFWLENTNDAEKEFFVDILYGVISKIDKINTKRQK